MTRDLLIGKDVRFEITVKLKAKFDGRMKIPKIKNGKIITRKTSGKIVCVNGDFCVIKCKDGSLHNRPISTLISAFGEKLKYNNLLEAQGKKL